MTSVKCLYTSTKVMICTFYCKIIMMTWSLSIKPPQHFRKKNTQGVLLLLLFCVTAFFSPFLFKLFTILLISYTSNVLPSFSPLHPLQDLLCPPHPFFQNLKLEEITYRCTHRCKNWGRIALLTYSLQFIHLQVSVIISIHDRNNLVGWRMRATLNSGYDDKSFKHN